MENAHCVDQRLRAEASGALPRLAVPTVSRAQTLARFLCANAGLLTKQGTVTEVWRRRGGRRLGPYYQLRYRDVTGSSDFWAVNGVLGRRTL